MVDNDNNIIIKKFNSAGEYLEWATHAPCLWKRELASRRIGNADWAGTDTYEEAYKLAKFGWPEGLKLLTKQMKIADVLLDKKSTYVRPQKSYGVAGHYPHIPRYIAGDPMHMVRRGSQFNMKPKDDKIVKIRANFSYRGRVDTNKIMTWGAAICSYINHLGLKGKRIELRAINEDKPSNGSGPDLSMQFKLKSAGQHLQKTAAVFWFAHPAAQRRIAFSARERLDIEQWYGGYGRAQTVTTPESGTIDLSIEDAGDSMEENLEIIRRKHEAVMEIGL